jgi:predicted MPP superfamily phosphohydrolase
MKHLFVLLFCAGSLLAQAGSISGMVFNDANGNGIRDTGETGMKGVAVSDQVNVVITDANGFYNLPNSKGFGYVFITQPNGFKAQRSYFQKVDLGLSAVHVDFALVKVNTPTQFKFIHASDTHISDKSLDRIARFHAVIDSVRPDFVLVTGDLVKDALRVGEKEATSLYELYKNEMAKVGPTVWNVPGNHEIFGIERELSKVSPDHPLYGRKMYRSYFGPDYYSFNYGGIHWVALNSLDYDDMWYYGGIDSVQREWLKKDLAAQPAKMPVVTFQHVPFFSGGISLAGYTESGLGRTLEKEKGKLKFRHVVGNAHEIITILQSHPFPLALAGHHHARQWFFLETEGQQTRFEQTAAVVGPGAEGAFKIPSGVVVYTVNNGEIDEGYFVKLK